MKDLIKLFMDELKKLDYLWYLKKRNEFETTGLYNPYFNKIYDTFYEFDYDGKEYEIKVDISFEDYAWSSFLAFQSNDPNALYDVSLVYFKLEEFIDSIIGEYSDWLSKYRILEIYEIEMKRYFAEQVKYANDENFTLVVNTLIDKISSCLRKKYYHIYNQYYLNYRFEDKLEFQIPQAQIAALLYFLAKANFFKNDEYDDSPAIFGEKYFFYPNQKSKQKMEKCKGLKKAYNKVKNNDSSSIDIIKDKLRSAIN